MIFLPDYPSPQSASPYLLDFGTVLAPTLGGPIQKINRLGNRFGIQVTMPPMKSQNDGRLWLSRLLRAKAEGGKMRWPLQGQDVGPVSNLDSTALAANPDLKGAAGAGVVLVYGAGIATSIDIHHATPGHVIREGTFFTFSSSTGHLSMHMTIAETIVNNSGIATLSLTPGIREPVVGEERILFGKPLIEGLVIGDRLQWEFAISRFTNIQFDIQEAV